jgi:hypothetical protein
MTTATYPVERPHELQARGRVRVDGHFNIRVSCKNCGEFYEWWNLPPLVTVGFFVPKRKLFTVTKVPAGVLVVAHIQGNTYAPRALQTLQFEDPCPGKKVL